MDDCFQRLLLLYDTRVTLQDLPEVFRIVRTHRSEILERFDGKVPNNIEDLLTLTEVGRKTANLVVTLGFGKTRICVDTLFHRIVSR